MPSFALATARFGIAVVSIAALFAGAQPARAAGPPLVAQKPIVVPGGPGAYDWMAVDAPMRRLLAAHKGAGTLVVLDLDKKSVRSVKTGAAQGIAIDPADDRYFVGDEKEEKVVVLNRKTLESIGEIKVAGPVDAIGFDPRNGKVYADHDDGTDVWVIDAKTMKLVGSVAVAGAPEYVEYDPVTDRLYQNIKPNDTVQVIDPAKNKVETTWSTAPANSPHGLAVDSKSRRLFTAGKNGKLVVISITTGKPVATVDIAKGVDQIAFDPANRRIYCACAGAISVAQETANGAALLGNANTPKGAHTLAVDPKTHAVWISYADDHASYLQEFIAH